MDELLSFIEDKTLGYLMEKTEKEDNIPLFKAKKILNKKEQTTNSQEFKQIKIRDNLSLVSFAHYSACSTPTPANY